MKPKRPRKLYTLAERAILRDKVWNTFKKNPNLIMKELAIKCNIYTDLCQDLLTEKFELLKQK